MLTLSPQARALAAVALAFLLVTGSLDRLGTAVSALLGDGLSTRTHMYAFLAVMIAVGVMIVLLAATATATGDAWSRSTAQAAVVLASVGIAIAVINLIDVMVHHLPSPFVPYLAG